MSDSNQHTDAVWDRFFDFVGEPVTTLSRQEVQSQLSDHGIDVAPAISRVQRAVATARARESLQTAAATRISLLEKLSSVVSPQLEGLKEQLNEVINGRLSGSLQAAYFRKLNEAADEEDLQRLLEDIERLNLLDTPDEADNNDK